MILNTFPSHDLISVQKQHNIYLDRFLVFDRISTYDVCIRPYWNSVMFGHSYDDHVFIFVQNFSTLDWKFLTQLKTDCLSRTQLIFAQLITFPYTLLHKKLMYSIRDLVILVSWFKNILWLKMHEIFRFSKFFPPTEILQTFLLLSDTINFLLGKQLLLITKLSKETWNQNLIQVASYKPNEKKAKMTRI